MKITMKFIYEKKEILCNSNFKTINILGDIKLNFTVNKYYPNSGNNKIAAVRKCSSNFVIAKYSNNKIAVAFHRMHYLIYILEIYKNYFLKPL